MAAVSNMMDDKKFNLLRRNSLRNEVDGIWDGLEAVEDGIVETDNNVSHSECLMLQRVLSDKSKIPSVCRNNPMQKTSSTQLATVQERPKFPPLVRRLTGGFPGAFNYDPAAPPAHKELGGPVTHAECEGLAAFLKPSVGGAYLLPQACTALLKKAEDAEREQYEAENAQVYKRLRRRMTEVHRQDYPPTFV